MKISTVNYFIGDAFKSFKRNKTISIATIITVLVTFIVLGVFLLVAENLNLAIGGLEDKIELVVYLDNDITPIDKKEIQVKINSQQGVKEIQYESREDAFKKLQENNAGILKGYTLEKNPLPASYIVKLEDMSYAAAIREAVKDLDGVESVSDEQESIDTIQSVIKFTKIIGTVLFIILIGVSIFLIMNTTKLTVYVRRKEVGIMKFVGATDWFIRWPFVIEGIIIGAVGSLASSLLLYFAYNGVFKWIVSSMFIVNLVQPQFVLTTLLACFVGGGIVVGAIGSIFALRKFLVV